MGRLELPISDAILEAVGLSPDPNLDIMSRLWEAAPASSIVVSALTPLPTPPGARTRVTVPANAEAVESEKRYDQ